MTPVRRCLVALAIASALLLALNQTAHAQAAAAPTPLATHADRVVDVSLDVLGGATSAPFITMDLPRVDGIGAALLLATRVRVRPMLAIGARVPLALVQVGQPAGSYVSEAAWGNPELFIEHSYTFGGSRPWFVRARLAVGAPLAEHGSSGLMEHRTLAIADALLAWRERELFVPEVVPITPAAELARPFQRWSAHAIVKLPVLVRASRATPEGTTNAVGLTPVLGLRARVDITSRLEVTGGAHAVFDLVRPIVWVDHVSRVQISAHADLVWRITAGVRLGATLIVPLGGALGGDTFAAGMSVAHTR